MSADKPKGETQGVRVAKETPEVALTGVVITPGGYLADEEGLLATGAAVGAEPILALLAGIGAAKTAPMVPEGIGRRRRDGGDSAPAVL